MKIIKKVCTMVFLVGHCSISQSKGLPSTEEFHNLLTGCAIGSKIEVNADLVGSIADIYRGDRTQGKAVIKNETKFLELIPEKDRLEAYKLYTACIENILPKNSSNVYQPPYKEPSEQEMKKAIVK